MDAKLAAAVSKLIAENRDLAARLERLEKIKPVAVNGRDGKDGVSPSVDEIVGAVIEKLPAPEKIDTNAIVNDVVSKIPKPRDGRDAPVVNVSDVAAIALAKIEKPKDGRDGKDGRPGPDLETVVKKVNSQLRDGKDGKQGPPGPPGRDGVSVTDVQLNNNDLFVYLDGKKRKAGSIKIPTPSAPFNPGNAGGGGSARGAYYDKQVVVRAPAQLSGTLRSDVVYFLDGVIDFTGTGVHIEVPAGGLNLRGHSFDVSGLRCDDDNYTMFVSAQGGSGNLLGTDYFISVPGAGAQVYDLTDATGFSAFEFQLINYNDCSSLGEINGYRQGLESGTGRFGGTPELTLSGAWVGGYRISTSIVRGLSNISALFKAGQDLTISGRFITDINCDLPAVGALLDFAPSNILNDESLIIQGAFITRQGVLDASDSGITPNIDQDSVRSNWAENTGIGNTQKYIKGVCDVEATTPVAAADTYYPLLGGITLEAAVQFTQPANGEYELLTGNGRYQVSGDITIVGTANDQIDIRVVKSVDGGLNFDIEVQHIQRQVNNLSGIRDVAFFPLNFVASLKKGDRLRLEVENKSAANDVTQELGSYLVITEI